MSTAISMRIYNTVAQSVTVYGKILKLLEMSEKTTEKSPWEINYTCNRNIKNIIYLASVCILTNIHTVNGSHYWEEWTEHWETERLQNKIQLVSTTTAWKIIFHVSHIMPKTKQNVQQPNEKKNDVHDIFVSQCWWYGLSACLLLIRLLVMLFLHFKYLVGTWYSCFSTTAAPQTQSIIIKIRRCRRTHQIMFTISCFRTCSAPRSQKKMEFCTCNWRQ